MIYDIYVNVQAFVVSKHLLCIHCRKVMTFLCESGKNETKFMCIHILKVKTKMQTDRGHKDTIHAHTSSF